MKELLSVTCFFGLLVPLALGATTYNVNTSMAAADIRAIAWGAQPGDTIIFGPGTYAIDFVLSHNGQPSPNGRPISGTAGNPITFTSNWGGNPANRPVIASDTTANGASLGIFNIMDKASYITIDGLHLKHSTTGATANTNCGMYVWGGVWFEGGASHITIQNCEIESITGTAIQMNYASDTSPTSSITIVNNSIHDLGTATGCGSNGGYGIWGGRARTGTSVILSDVYIAGNVIYNTGGVDSYAIAMGYGWIRTTISDNIIYNSPRGVGTGTRYTILLQVDNGLVTRESDMVVVARNLIYASNDGISGNKNVAVQVTPGCAFENNLIVDSYTAVAIRRDNWPNYDFCRVSYNTVFNGFADGSTGVFSLNGLSASDTNRFVVSNNAVFTNCGSACGTAWEVGWRCAYRWVGAQSSNMIASSNYFQGGDPGEAAASVMKMLESNDPTVYFNAPNGVMGSGADFVPMSTLIGNGTALTTPTNDFDSNLRPSANPSVGCFQAGVSPHSSLTFSIRSSPPRPPPGPPNNDSVSRQVSMLTTLFLSLRQVLLSLY